MAKKEHTQKGGVFTDTWRTKVWDTTRQTKSGTGLGRTKRESIERAHRNRRERNS